MSRETNRSSNRNLNNPSSSNSGGHVVPMLNQLLAVAAEAQGDRPMDPNHSQMSEEDRAWLDSALNQIAADSDPVKKLKRWMARLEEVGEPGEQNIEDIRDILEEIGDLVCDMDLAQYFCSLDGLALLQRLLSHQFDPCSALCVHLVGVLAQYNQRVQQLLLRNTQLLQHCVATCVDPQKSMDYRHKCVGAISAMVKAYLPGLIRFVELEGPEKLMRCFESGLELDSTKLSHRCAVAARAIKLSYSVEVVNIGPAFRRVAQLTNEMRAKLLERNEGDRWRETLEFLAD